MIQAYSHSEQRWIDDIVFQEVVNHGEGEAKLILRTWTATDLKGVSSVFKQYIEIHDSTAPQLTEYPEDITVECFGCDTIANVNIRAVDNCRNEVEVDYEEV